MSRELPAPLNEGVPDGSGEILAPPAWSLRGGKKNAVVDRARIDQIDEAYPLPAAGTEDLNLAGRVIATTMLAIETAQTAPTMDIDPRLRAAIETAVLHTYPLAEAMRSYTLNQELKAATAQFDETNTAVLAIISKMYRQGLIGPVAKGRSEAIIRLLLSQEDLSIGV